MKKSITLFFILLFPLVILANEVILHKHDYVMKNECKQIRRSEHNSLYLVFELPASFVQNELTGFKAVEKLTNNQQEIAYMKNYFLYKKIFNLDEHREYNLPECDQQTCRFDFQVFLTNWKDLKDELEIELEVLAKNSIKNQKVKFSKIKNNFFSAQESVIDQLKIEYKDGFATAEISKATVKQLRKNMDSIDLMLQYRLNKEQHAYSIKEFNLKKEKRNYFKIQIENPTYLALELFFAKGPRSFENKIEIINVNNPFYSCSQARGQ